MLVDPAYFHMANEHRTRSVGGISHAPDEWTHWTDVERGVQLLCNCVMELACAPERVNPLEQSVSR